MPTTILSIVLLVVLVHPVVASPCNDFTAAVNGWEIANKEYDEGDLPQAIVDRLEAQLASDEAARALRTYVRNQDAILALKALEDAVNQVTFASLMANSWRMEGAPEAPNASRTIDYEAFQAAESVNKTIDEADRAIVRAYYEAVSVMASCR